MNKFSELSLSAVLHSNLTRLGYVDPTPVQAQAIPAVLAGRDVIATAQTGTGKTLAFALPIVECLMNRPAAGIQAVILSPTRELAIQIHDAFVKVAAGTGLRTAVVVGGLNEQTQLRALRAGASVVIATPGRLCDFLDRKLVKLGTARFLVLDEADRMLDMGFLPSLRRILSEVPAKRQTLFFSATIEPSVAHLVESHLKDPVRVSIGSTTKPAENVQLDLYEVEQEIKLGLLRTILTAEKGSVLVFARTKHGTDRLAKQLSGTGVHAARIHGDRTQNQRNQALKGFQNGDYRVLVATDVAARGIHVDGIAHVINYDLPQVPEDFIHRVGRTGRAGALGVASTFATRAQRGDIGRIEKTLKVRMNRLAVPASALGNVIVLPARTAPRRDGVRPARGRRLAT
jgi:ATP-dependent RNA helicase RhlE